MTDEQQWAIEGWAQYVSADFASPDSVEYMLPSNAPRWLVDGVRDRLQAHEDGRPDDQGPRLPDAHTLTHLPNT